MMMQEAGVDMNLRTLLAVLLQYVSSRNTHTHTTAFTFQGLPMDGGDVQINKFIRILRSERRVLFVSAARLVSIVLFLFN